MRLQQVRLIAFDMDGTLLNSQSQMTEATGEACRALREKGYKLVLSTGRTYASAKLPTDGFGFDGYVCSNGAAVYEPDGTMVRCTPLHPVRVVGIWRVLQQQPLYYEVHDTGSNRWMAREDRDQIAAVLDADPAAEGLDLRRLSFAKWVKAVDGAELEEGVLSGAICVVKFFIWHQDPSVLDQVRQQLASWDAEIDVTSSGVTNLEINAKGVTKWQGVRYFCDKWQLDASQVMAFGDAANDLPILSRVGVPVAMANAPDEVKRLARFTAPHHDADGVARFLREHLLGGPQRPST